MLNLAKKGSLLKDKSEKFLIYVFIVFLSAFFFLPVFMILTTSLKTTQEITIAGFRWFPLTPQFINYSDAFGSKPWFRYFFNSFFVTVIVVLGSLLLNSSTGYALSRLRFKGQKFILILFLTGLMIPPQTYIVPQFIIMKKIPFAGGNNILGNGGIGWLNSYWALIMPLLVGPVGIFLCRQFYLTFPRALDEAAKIDGCSPIRSYFYIFLPLSKPILATLTILKFVYTWNDFFYPLIMTSSDELATVQLALQKFKGQYSVQWNQLMAATVVTILPILIVFLSAQRYFVQGIVTSGIKG